MKPLFIHIASPEQLTEIGFIGANCRSDASTRGTSLVFILTPVGFSL